MESIPRINFQKCFIGTRALQVFPVKICSLGYTLVDEFFLENYLYLIFQKQWVTLEITVD